MKKIISLVLSVVMLLTTVIYVTAAETQTTISLTLDESMENYTLTIPATVEIDPATKKGTINLEIFDYEFVWSDCISVDARFSGELVCTEDENKTIAYEIKGPDGRISSSSLDNIIEIYKDENKSSYSSGDLEISLNGSYPGAGTYTDTITFTVSHEVY